MSAAGEGASAESSAAGPPLLSGLDLESVAAHIRDGRVREVVVMCGAGISTAAGIPDFRSPGTGLYDNLQKYDLPTAESIFTLSYFRERPEPFYSLCKEMWPGQYAPTMTHCLFGLLHRKGILRRVYTQNIDSLECSGGLLPKSALVAAHGNFDSASCIGESAYDEKFPVPIDELKRAVNKGETGWRALAEKHGGLVKPDIVFFGEDLPDRFANLIQEDFAHVDLLLVFGTSLQVHPFAGLIQVPDNTVPRVLFNRDKCGLAPKDKADLLSGDFMPRGFRFDLPDNARDVFAGGPCDDGAEGLASRLGWADDLRALYDATRLGSELPLPPVQLAPWA